MNRYTNLFTKYGLMAISGFVFLGLLTTATAFAARPAVDEEDDISVTTSNIRKLPCYGYGCDKQNPYVRITSPVYSPVAGRVIVSAAAKDNVRVSEVQFFIDGILMKVDRFAPYAFVWNTAKANNGWHSITATQLTQAATFRAIP
jgi:hypothetical protein